MFYLFHVLIMDVRVCVRCEAEKGKGDNTFRVLETEEWTAALLRWPRRRDAVMCLLAFLVTSYLFAWYVL